MYVGQEASEISSSVSDSVISLRFRHQFRSRLANYRFFFLVSFRAGFLAGPS